VPLERFEPEDRYTTQVHRWFQQKFTEHGFDYKIIEGVQLTKTIEHGEFLDTYGTIYYKSSQIQKIAKLFRSGKVKDGDIFFVYDFEFPGLEAIRYMATLSNLDIKIYAWAHAGSYTHGDFMEPCADYAKYFELGWWKMCDGIFVGSEYHKKAIIERRIDPYVQDCLEGLELDSKIHVTGNPWNTEEVLSMVKPLPEKEDIIIFPHRLAWEKRPNLFLDLCLILVEKHPELLFLITTSRPTMRSSHPWLIKLYKAIKKLPSIGTNFLFESDLSKQQYYRWLARSKIMFSSSVEENFGYTCLEAMTFQTFPLCPNRYSYPELITFTKNCLYGDMDDAINKVEKLLNQKPGNWLSMDAKRYDNSINKMIKIMGAK